MIEYQAWEHACNRFQVPAAEFDHNQDFGPSQADVGRTWSTPTPLETISKPMHLHASPSEQHISHNSVHLLATDTRSSIGALPKGHDNTLPKRHAEIVQAL